MLEEVDEHSQDFRFNGHQLAGTAQLIALCVEFVVAKAINHGRYPCTRTPRVLRRSCFVQKIRHIVKHVLRSPNSDQSAAHPSHNSHNVVKICGLLSCIVEIIQASEKLYKATRLLHGGTTYATHTAISRYCCRRLVPGPWGAAPG